ncbi:GM14729 [Drosophila sechellia]|uniref:GM14729 n=1 Tax=Drosophila sechellia TaxID=7238 RepID=B4HUK3_DROSE|nr:GM14729 [Drosophila sechellia]
MGEPGGQRGVRGVGGAGGSAEQGASIRRGTHHTCCCEYTRMLPASDSVAIFFFFFFFFVFWQPLPFPLAILASNRSRHICAIMCRAPVLRVPRSLLPPNQFPVPLQQRCGDSILPFAIGASAKPAH